MSEFLLIALILIHVGDVVTTWVGIRNGAYEASPLPGALFQKLGFWPGVLLLKGLLIGIAILVTLYVREAYWFTGLLDLGGLYVLWSNWRVIHE